MNADDAASELGVSSTSDYEHLRCHELLGLDSSKKDQTLTSVNPKVID